LISKSIDVSENNKNDFSNLEFNIKIKKELEDEKEDKKEVWNTQKI
jgi:hypothetical protein